MLFLSLILVSFLSVIESQSGLIREIMRRERLNVALMHLCNDVGSVDFLKDLSTNFSGFIQILQENSNRFYEDFSRTMSTRHHRVCVIVDLECPAVMELLEFSSQHSHFNGSYNWILYSRARLRSVRDKMKNLNLNVDSRVTIALADQKDSERYRLFEIFNTVKRQHGKLNVKFVGSWTPDKGLQMTCNTKSYQYRKDLKGITLKTAVSILGVKWNTTLEEHLRSMDSPNQWAVDRFGYRIVQLLSHHHNFKVKFILTLGWGLQYLGTNSTKGIVGQLQQNLVDMSSMPLALQSDRLSSYAAVGVVSVAKFIIIFRHPKYSSTTNVFFQPFESYLWFAIVAALITSVIAVLVVNKFRSTVDVLDKINVTLIIFGFICQQGIAIKTVLLSFRMIVIALLMFCVIIYQFYSSFLLGFLLVLPVKTIKSLEQLLESDLHLSIEETSYNRLFFNKTKDQTAIELYEKKVQPNKYGFVDVNTGLALVKRGGHAFQCEVSYGYNIIQESFDVQEICELQEVILFPFRPLHMVLPLGSPLKELFRVSVRRLMETGVAQYYTNKFYIERPRCVQNSYAAVQIKLSDIDGPFWMLAWATGVAVVLLVVENFVHRVSVFLETRRVLRHYPVWLE